jgi:hypothetical protein
VETYNTRLREIWRRANPPVLFRRGSGDPLLVRLPYAGNNFDWLRDDKRHKPQWNKQFKCWEVPVAWYDWLARRLVKKYASAYLVQLFREQQKCAPACWNAHGLHCECSCMGANHGTGHPGGRWHEVSETFAFEWGPKMYACRLLVPVAS